MSSQAKPPVPRRRRRWLRRLAFVLFGCGLALVATEIWLRYEFSAMFGPASDMRWICDLDADGWTRPVPDRTFELLYSGIPTTVHMNALGLRGAEVTPPVPGETRVLLLGDSMPYGVGVQDDQTFPNLLESRIAELTGGPALSRSGGAPNFNVFDQAKVLAGVRDAFAPDLIVSCVFLGNDFEDNYYTKTVVDGYMLQGHLAEAALASTRFRMALRFRTWWFFEHFTRTYFPNLAFPIPPPNAEMVRDFPKGRRMGLFLDAAEETPAFARIMDRMELALGEVKRAAGDIPLLVVMLPSPQHAIPQRYTDELKKLELDPETHVPGTVQRRLAERCARLGLPVFDLTPAFQGMQGKGGLFLKRDFHYNVQGHEIAADALAPAIVETLNK